jgi:hypothetical protein
MGKLSTHLRNSLVAGALAVVPVAVTAFAIWYVESKSRSAVEQVLGYRVPPFVGVLLTVALIYAVGVVVTSLIGRLLIRLTDRVLNRLPVVRTVYAAWKQVGAHARRRPGHVRPRSCWSAGSTPARRALPDAAAVVGGRPTDRLHQRHAGPRGRAPVARVRPAVPEPAERPAAARAAAHCRATTIAPEEAFKMLLSAGNYLPPGLAGGAGGPPDR